MSNFNNISAGKNPPKDINVIIEIPANSGPVKYEVDKDSGSLHVDRFMTTAMSYPCNYGYLPQSLAEDGDPADILVMTPVPLVPGSIIRARPVGMMKMTDEAGGDNKILAVPQDKLTPAYHKIHSIKDVDQWFLDSIQHFFSHYKDLEKGKWVKIVGWFDVAEAEAEIMSSIERFKKR